MFILLICNSLTSKFIVEIDDNAIAVISVDLISCLLKVECYFLTSFRERQKYRFYSNKYATRTTDIYCLAFHPSSCM